MIETKHLDNGFTYLDVNTQHAHLKVALQGAHVFYYKPHEKKEILWLSQESFFEKGVAIRGGVPICWPWFGKHESDENAPQHGFARTTLWEFLSTDENDPDKTIITLVLKHDNDTLKIWPHKFRLTLEITITETLTISLNTYNDDKQSFTITQALHTYFQVNDINSVTIKGLEGVAYIDQLDYNQNKSSNSPIIISQEVDRVYKNSNNSCVLQDTFREILITTEGSSSTVVWNPWIEKEKRMKDFHNNGYKEMVCIETANALSEKVTIKKAQSHTITQVISFK